MIRIILIAVATMFAANVAFANGDYSYAPRYTHKLCQGKTWRGVAVDFPCNLDEKCCFDRLRGKGYCAKSNGRRGLFGRCMFKTGY